MQATATIDKLYRARDWIFEFHLPEWEKSSWYLFPHDVAYTHLQRIQDVHYPRAYSTVGTNIQVWKSKNTEKYMSEIAAQCNDGWTVVVLAVEVGVKGWIPPSFFRN